MIARCLEGISRIGQTNPIRLCFREEGSLFTQRQRVGVIDHDTKELKGPWQLGPGYCVSRK